MTTDRASVYATTQGKAIRLVLGLSLQEAVKFHSAKPDAAGKLRGPQVATITPVIERANGGIGRVPTGLVQAQVLGGFNGCQKIAEDHRPGGPFVRTSVEGSLVVDAPSNHDLPTVRCRMAAAVDVPWPSAEFDLSALDSVEPSHQFRNAVIPFIPKPKARDVCVLAFLTPIDERLRRFAQHIGELRRRAWIWEARKLAPRIPGRVSRFAFKLSVSSVIVGLAIVRLIGHFSPFGSR